MAFRNLKMAPHHFLVLVVTVAIYIALLVFSMNKQHTTMTSQHLLNPEPHHVDTKQHKTHLHADPERVKRLPVFHPILNIHHPKIHIAELQRFTKSDVKYVAANDEEESSLSGDSAAAVLDMSSNAVFSRSFADNRPKPRRILPKNRDSSKYIYNKHIYAKLGQSTRPRNSNSKHIEVMSKNDELQNRSYNASISRVFTADEQIASQGAIAVADAKSSDQRMPTCKPHTNVVYIKTHKTGSSTLQNIIYRFGDERNLTFALPAHGVYIPSVREFKASSILPAPQGGQYNILANHVRFFENDIKSIMPSDTKFITIVRKSADQFQSMYTYFTMETQYKATIEQYSINPEYFYGKFGKGRFTRHSGRDPMLFDLGMGKRDSEDPTRVHQHIEFLDQRFDLVLVLEHFYESLILLRELMCWDLESLAHVSNKIRVSFAPEVTKLSVEDQRAADDVARRLDRWNAGDVRMYDHFNRTLWRRIDAYGRSRMEKEVSELKDLCWRYEQECMNGTSVRDISRGSLEQTGLLEYVVKPSQTNNATCQRLAMIPKFYLSQLREKHIKRFHENRTN